MKILNLLLVCYVENSIQHHNYIYLQVLKNIVFMFYNVKL